MQHWKKPDMISEVRADLKPNFGNLSINSTPTGAVVIINGQIKGKTPYNIQKIKSDSYNIQKKLILIYIKLSVDTEKDLKNVRKVLKILKFRTNFSYNDVIKNKDKEKNSIIIKVKSLKKI